MIIILKFFHLCVYGCLYVYVRIIAGLSCHKHLELIKTRIWTASSRSKQTPTDTNTREMSQCLSNVCLFAYLSASLSLYLCFSHFCIVLSLDSDYYLSISPGLSMSLFPPHSLSLSLCVSPFVFLFLSLCLSSALRYWWTCLEHPSNSSSGLRRNESPAIC